MMKHIRSSPCLHQGPKSPSGDLPNGRQSLFSQCQWLMDVLWDTEWKALAAVCASAFCHSEELTCLRNCSRFEKLWLAWESWNRTIMFRPYHDHATYCNLKAFHEINLQKTCWPKVFNLMQGHQESVRGTRHLSLLNQEICNRGFMRLLGLGKHRFQNHCKCFTGWVGQVPHGWTFFTTCCQRTKCQETSCVWLSSCLVGTSWRDPAWSKPHWKQQKTSPGTASVWRQKLAQDWFASHTPWQVHGLFETLSVGKSWLADFTETLHKCISFAN